MGLATYSKACIVHHVFQDILIFSRLLYADDFQTFKNTVHDKGGR